MPHMISRDPQSPPVSVDARLLDGELAEQRTQLYVLDPDSYPVPAVIAALPEATR